MNNIRYLDAQLLLTLQALLTEKHVSKAALKLFKSQPAVSHSLAELRRIFDDPLLVRKNAKFETTVRAEEILELVNEILSQMQMLLRPKIFDPALAKRTFKIGISDYGARIVLPQLVADIRKLAPEMNLQFTQASRESMYAQVMDGELDFAFGVFTQKFSESVERFSLYKEQFKCVVDAQFYPHELNFNQWLNSPHILVAMQANSANEIDRVLLKKGFQRRIAVTLSHWSVANELVKNTDLILTIAERNLSNLEHAEGFRIFSAPIEIASFDFEFIWHKRCNNDLAHQWLAKLIRQQFNHPVV